MHRALGSWQRVFLALAPALVVVFLAYVVSARVYYASRFYPFHPFLQVQPPSLEGVPKEKPAGVFRILALGGSTTRDVALKEDERYPAVLEQILREQFPQLRIEVLNGGMDWYTTEHALIYYEFYARDWRPDLVVFFEAINDLYRSCSPPDFAVGEFKRDYSHFYGPVIRAYHTPSFESWLLSHLSRGWYAGFRVGPVASDFPLEFFQSAAVHERNLRALIRVMRAEDKPLIIATQASLYRADLSPDDLRVLWFAKKFCHRDKRYPNHTSMMRAMKKVNDTIRQVALDECIPLADLDAAVPKTREYFLDDVHSTARGARVVAETVANAIREAGYIR